MGRFWGIKAQENSQSSVSNLDTKTLNHSFSLAYEAQAWKGGRGKEGGTPIEKENKGRRRKEQEEEGGGRKGKGKGIYHKKANTLSVNFRRRNFEPF